MADDGERQLDLDMEIRSMAVSFDPGSANDGDSEKGTGTRRDN